MHILLAVALLAQTANDTNAKIDAVFAKYAKPDSPGCVVGVARAGQTIARAYGMANLEYDVPLSESTIFEAGSVSKQFTAQAVVLLAQDGKLSLDDPVRKYIPELDASASKITIRQMLNHTSGLRDWGVIVGLEGWRRGSRLFTMKHVLDVISRQRELNFEPGTQWSYSNSGYNLAAIIVERVSGKSFSDFTRERIFIPQGMTHSSWRDDYTRVVKGRATAYDPADGGGYVADMDIENIYGNCCLLTTVGDLLKFKTLPEQEKPSVLASGKQIDYGLGVFIDDVPNHRDIYHSGATAGWRALLTRRADDDLSIAVLCNRGDAGTAGLIRNVSAIFVAPQPTPSPAPTPKDAQSLAGLYRDARTNAILRLFFKDDRLRLGLRDGGQGVPLTPLENGRYRISATSELRAGADGLRLVTLHKPEAIYTRVEDAKPKLADYAGSYRSAEVGVTYEIAMDGDHLVAKLAPARVWRLDPTYRDGFITENEDLVHFTRDSSGRVNGFDVKAGFSPIEGQARVERVHFSLPPAR